MFTGSVCVLLTSVSLKLIKNKNIINLRNHEFARKKKQNGGWKVSDADWFYFSFYGPSCFNFFMIRVQFYFILIFSIFIRVGPSRSELIRPGLAAELIRWVIYTIYLINI